MYSCCALKGAGVFLRNFAAQDDTESLKRAGRKFETVGSNYTPCVLILRVLNNDKMCEAEETDERGETS